MCSAVLVVVRLCSLGVGTATWRVLRGVVVSGAANGPGRASVGDEDATVPELKRFDEGPCEPDHRWDGCEPCAMYGFSPLNERCQRDCVSRCSIEKFWESPLLAEWPGEFLPGETIAVSRSWGGLEAGAGCGGCCDSNELLVDLSAVASLAGVVVVCPVFPRSVFVWSM